MASPGHFHFAVSTDDQFSLRFDTGASNWVISAVCGALPLKVSTLPSDEIATVIAIPDVAGQDHLGERILEIALDHPLQRPCAVGGVPALGGEPVARRGIERQHDLAIGQELLEPRELDLDDPAHLAPLKTVEQDDLVDAVQELRPEMPPHHSHHLLAHGRRVLAFRLIHQKLRTEVRGHDDQRVAEIDGTALAIGQAAVVEHLQQDVEHVGMRFLDLVEQHHLVRPAPHRFGERAALVIADIARRRADQPRDRVLLHVFGHVETNHRGLVVEEILRERLGQLGLADAGGAQEHERAHRPVRVLEPRARTAHGGRDRMDGFGLADDALPS